MDYTSVRVTEALSEVIEQAGDGGEAASELREWKEREDRTTIPFSLVHSLHKHTAKSAGKSII